MYVGCPNFLYTFHVPSHYRNKNNQSRPLGWQYSVLRGLVERTIDIVSQKGEPSKIEVNLRNNSKVCIRGFYQNVNWDNEFCMDIDLLMGLHNPGSLFCSEYMRVVANALFPSLEIQCFKEGIVRCQMFENGVLVKDHSKPTSEKNGSLIRFDANDVELDEFCYNLHHVEMIINHLLYLAPTVTISFNGKDYYKPNGLKELIDDRIFCSSFINFTSFGFPTIHLKDEHFEVAFTLSDKHELQSFANGYRTLKGGEHERAFRRSFQMLVRNYFNIPSNVSKKVLSKMIIAIKIQMDDPVYDHSLRISLGSREIKEGVTFKKYIEQFLQKYLVDYFDEHQDVVNTIKNLINTFI